MPRTSKRAEKVMTPKEMAEAVKKEVVERTGGWLNPDYMYIWTHDPADHPEGKALPEYGFSQGEYDAELCMEEVGEYDIEQAINAAVAKHPDIEGRFDFIQGRVIGFMEGW